MSVMAAKAAAAKAAAAIQAQLQGAGSGADVNSKYPGMPIAWGLNMTEAQRETAYAQHTRQSRRLYVGSTSSVPHVKEHNKTWTSRSYGASSPQRGAHSTRSSQR